MLKLMLEGVNDLLEEATEAKTVKAKQTFIVCASAVLEKCIASLEDNVVMTQTNGLLQGEALDNEVKRLNPKKTKVSQEYEIRVDNKKLVAIVDKNGNEAPSELLLEIDGKQLTYEEAKGKPFTEGKFL